MSAAAITDAHLPTLAQPDSDPRIWLEDVTGEEALAWVKARNAAALSSFGAIALALASRHFCHAAGLTPLQHRHLRHLRRRQPVRLGHVLSDPGDPGLEGKDPVHRPRAERPLLQLLAGRDARPRHLAAVHPRRVPQGESPSSCRRRSTGRASSPRRAANRRSPPGRRRSTWMPSVRRRASRGCGAAPSRSTRGPPSARSG